jgi:hypothetical protein
MEEGETRQRDARVLMFLSVKPRFLSYSAWAHIACQECSIVAELQDTV